MYNVYNIHVYMYSTCICVMCVGMGHVYTLTVHFPKGKEFYNAAIPRIYQEYCMKSTVPHFKLPIPFDVVNGMQF